MVVVSDPEQLFKQLRTPASCVFPAQNSGFVTNSKSVADTLAPKATTKSKRAEMLLKQPGPIQTASSSFQSMIRKNTVTGSQKNDDCLDVRRILETERIMIVSLSVLKNVLEYLESSFAEWHMERGLRSEYKDRADIIAITSREKGNVLNCSIPSKGNVLFGNGNISCCDSFFQEVHEFGTNANG